MKPRALIAGLICAVGLHAAASSTSAVAPDECRWTTVPPVIDGFTDEAAWKQAQVIERFRTSWLPEGQRQPPTATKARLLWDYEYLYFSAQMEDTDVFANITEHDAAIWTCDVFELFFKPAADKPGYYEFEVNAANGQLDMYLPSRGAGGYSRHKAERPFHMESAVQVRGTINHWADKDRGWTVEGRIPWRDFLSTGGRPAPGEIWQHALCRYDYSVGQQSPALSTNANLSVGNFHQHEDYVSLRFIGPNGDGETLRTEWNTSRLKGSPEPPLRFQGAPAFPKLELKQPIMAAVEPGGKSLLLLECNGYVQVRTSRVKRFANDSNVAESELLLEFDEAIYDVCFHPKFAENGYVYFGGNERFAEGKMDFNTHVLRYTMDRKSGRIDPASRKVIIEWHSHGHNGAALTFGKDGMLYVTSGDGTSDSDEWESGQDLTRLLAKVLRIDVDRPEPGKAYSVPRDNPFLQTPGARPETWAYGFRNPWRMTLDRETGDLWVGENGQDHWEYARLVRRGENYGWPIVEGSHPFHQNRRRGPTPITFPLIEHPHTDFRSLTGGIVYRGSKFPDLVGCYVYGDYSTGQIWAAKQEGGKLIRHECIADTTFSIAGFCETPAGDILIMDWAADAIRKLELAPAIAPSEPFPRQLSETGLFVETRGLKPHSALIPFDVNAPGWHDGAVSERYVALPGQARMEVTEQGGWNFPDGTAVVQTLTLNNVRIESRVLLRQQNEWAGYSYIWNEAQTDATLAPPEGETRRLASGQPWRIPGKQECMSCHSRAANFVLGLSTVQLNRADQIAKWERSGLVTGDHAKFAESQWRKEFTDQKLERKALQAAMGLVTPNPLQRQPPKESALLARGVEPLIRIVNPGDLTASLDDRARAYLHANCSHCHAAAGGGNSPLKLAHNFALDEMQIIAAEPMHTTFGLAAAKVVAPGDPAKSLLVHRTVLRGPGQMPPVGTMVPDGAGVNLLAQWIASLPPSQSPATKPAQP